MHFPSSSSSSSSCSSSHSQSADVSHCSPVFLPFSSPHLPPLSSHSVYSCQALFSSFFILFSSSHSVIQCGIVHLLIFCSFLSVIKISALLHSPSLSPSLSLFSPWAGRAPSRMLWLMLTFLFRHSLVYGVKWKKLIKWILGQKMILWPFQATVDIIGGVI